MTDDATPIAGDGLVEPHGLEEVGEAIELPAEPAPTEPSEVLAVDSPEAPVAPVEEAVDSPDAPVAPVEEAAAEAPDEGAEAPGEDAEVPDEGAETADEAAEAPDEGAETADEAAEAPDEPATETPPPLGARTVARLVADTLRSAGVKFAFTVPGESFLGLLESFGEAGIRIVATRHESGAAFMAEAYGQLTGRPAAVLATRAVGASNLAIGIHTARADSAPMFVLVGQVERGFRGREAFQEVELATTVGGLATWAAEIESPESAPTILAEATRRAATGRPGPVLLACPEDVMDEDATGQQVPTARAVPARLDPDDIRDVIELVARAERPVILAGAGVLRARCSRELVRFAELLGVPVIASWRRPDVFPNDHPLYLGMSGYYAPPVVRDRLTTTDGLLVLGCRLNEPTSFGYEVPGPGTRWAHVDVEPRTARAGLRAPDVALASDAAVFLRAAVARLERGVLDAEQTRRREAATEADRSRYEDETRVDRGSWDGPGVHPGVVVATLRRVLPDDAIVATDAGNFGGWLARGYRSRRPATFLGPTSGAMGYALPAAIAAAIVHRDRPVVAVAGDGGFAMTMTELETAVRERVRPIAIVFDNERYGTIRMHQERRASGSTVGTDLGPIDFVAVAEALGARGVRIDSTDAFEPALREALGVAQPSVLHLRLDRSWVSVDEAPAA